MKKIILTTLLLLGATAPAIADVITVDGTIIDGQAFTSQLSVKAHDVVIRNCTIDMAWDGSDGFYGISNVYYDANGDPLSTNLLIENCTVRGGTTGIYVHHANVFFNDIQDVGSDAMKCSTRGNARFIGNHTARLGLIPGSHADGLQLVGGSNVLIAYNHFDIPISHADSGPWGSNAGIMIHDGNADISRIFIFRNLFDGGNYSIFLTHKNGSPWQAPTLCRVNYNTFTHDYRFGPFSWDYDPLIQVNGNRWDDGSLMDYGQWDINTWDDWPNQ